MISTTDIQISSYSVGSLALDGPGVRGEGGARDPRLVIPTAITMAPQPREKQIAVTELTYSLHLGPDAHDYNQIGPTASLTFLPELHARSIEKNPNEYRFELRFGLTAPLVDQLDAIHQASPNGDLRLQVRPKLTVSLIYQVSGEAPIRPSVRPIPDFPFGLDYGIACTLAHFWNSTISHFALEIPRSTWVERVLPVLGVNHVRTLEIGLPRTLGSLPAETLRSFDAARSELDNGRGRVSSNAVAHAGDVLPPKQTCLSLGGCVSRRFPPSGDSLLTFQNGCAILRAWTASLVNGSPGH